MPGAGPVYICTTNHITNHLGGNNFFNNGGFSTHGASTSSSHSTPPTAAPAHAARAADADPAPTGVHAAEEEEVGVATGPPDSRQRTSAPRSCQSTYATRGTASQAPPAR